ncbi:MAG: FtsX-like permease family protein [Phycisphaerales bacterium]
MKRCAMFHVRCAMWTWLCVMLFALPVWGDEASFKADLDALTRSPHRLAGSPEGRAAGDYIAGRLRAMGVKDVFEQSMDVWYTDVEQCEISVGERRLGLLPMRPNLVVPPCTPAEGITGPLMYVGKGAISDYGTRDPRGAIVVLDYNCEDHWRQAFELGAAAVLFLPDADRRTPTEQPRQMELPINLVRLYIPPATAGQFDFTRDQAKVTLRSRVKWKQGIGRNIIAYLPGTHPHFSEERPQPEAMVLSAYYDGFGQVPQDNPAARGAANVAALLEAAQQFIEHPTRRDLLICFFDAHGQDRQGAREFYRRLLSTDDQIRQAAAAHQSERRFVEQAMTALSPTEPRLDVADADIHAAVMETLRRQAEYLREDLNMRARGLRLSGRKDAPAYQQLVERVGQWDDVRRALGTRHIERLDPIRYAQLREQTVAVFSRRMTELELLIRRDAQWRSLRQRVAMPWVALHVSYDLSDATGRWAVIVSDATMRLLARNSNAGDNPGYYTRILGTLRRSAAEISSASGISGVKLENATLEDPAAGRRYCAYPLLSDGYVAGYCGIYNIALVTSADAQTREGGPTDTADHLNWRNLRAQAIQATRLIAAAADNSTLSQPRVFQQSVHQSDPVWLADRMESSGNFVGEQVTGGLREQRPAAQTLVMLWPVFNAGDPFADFDRTTLVRGIQLTPMTATDMHGLYPMTWLRKDFFGNFGALAVQFDEQGLVRAVPNDATVIQHVNALARTDIFRGQGFVTFHPALSDVTTPVQFLQAISDSAVRNTLSFSGGSNKPHAAFCYVSDIIATPSRFKVVQPDGPILLGNTGDQPLGIGFPLDQLRSPQSVDARTAHDLWQLNESRLRTLRQRGVVDVNLESIHDDARRLLADSTAIASPSPSSAAPDLNERLGRWTESTARSRHVYQPVRDAMNDLVHAVVVLLLLAIPFAFSLERLLIGASGIYKRLGGFILIFLVTFILLYWLHPGFAIATTPIIIFLAFAIILLSSLVIYIVLRKFHTELNAIHGRGSRRHALSVSRAGTLIAAVNMGMSTMRRRPLRTALTALTVVILTFTILCFASVGNELGVREIYLGPAPPGNREVILLHQLDFSPIPADALDIATHRAGARGLVAAQWWLVRQTGDNPFTIARHAHAPESENIAASPPDASASGQVLFVDAVMGIDPAELSHWPALVAALSGSTTNSDQVRQLLQRGGAFLPQLIAKQLDLQVGDQLLVAGRPAFFAGAFDTDALQRLKNLDDQSMLPVDFQDPALAEFRKQQQQQAGRQQAPDLNTQRNFVRLSPAQIAITSDDSVRAAGGNLSVIKLYPAEQSDIAKLADDLATDLPLPVWTRTSSGVQRLFFTSLPHLSGGLALFVPLILGGLIIFGTMLGSIADRQKEIYTFSALGLAPAHVGMLFFAEASVYAVVGGMGGQLLAQAVAKIAAALAHAGLIAPPTITFSSSNAMFAILVVMAVVLISAIYPAGRASRSANPGVQRHWKMPPPVNDRMTMTFPFTVSAYDITGVISFLAEHFREHDAAGLGSFAVQSVSVARDPATGNLALNAVMALAPFDLGVTQQFQITARRSEIPGVDEVLVTADRRTGSRNDWQRALRVFIADLRKQFLLWRTVPPLIVEQYRLKTLTELGIPAAEGTP